METKNGAERRINVNIELQVDVNTTINEAAGCLNMFLCRLCNMMSVLHVNQTEIKLF